MSKEPRAYYVFFYRSDQARARRQHRASGWKAPKEFYGPFLSKAKAERFRNGELRKWGQDLAPNYVIKYLTPSQLERAWKGTAWDPAVISGVLARDFALAKASRK